MILTVLGILGILFWIAIVIDVLRRHFRTPKKAVVPELKLPPAPPSPDGDRDELVAARFRQTVQRPPVAHPIEEPFRKALIQFAREWGMSVESRHHFYDFSDHDKHVVNANFECMTKKEKKSL